MRICSFEYQRIDPYSFAELNVGTSYLAHKLLFILPATLHVLQLLLLLRLELGRSGIFGTIHGGGLSDGQSWICLAR